MNITQPLDTLTIVPRCDHGDTLQSMRDVDNIAMLSTSRIDPGSVRPWFLLMRLSQVVTCKVSALRPHYMKSHSRA